MNREDEWERIAQLERDAELGRALNRVLAQVGAQEIEFDHDGDTTYARTCNGNGYSEGAGLTATTALTRLADALEALASRPTDGAAEVTPPTPETRP